MNKQDMIKHDMGRHDTLPDPFFWSHTYHLEELGHYWGNYLKFLQESNINQSKHIGSGYYVYVALWRRMSGRECLPDYDVSFSSTLVKIGQAEKPVSIGQYQPVLPTSRNLRIDIILLFPGCFLLLLYIAPRGRASR
jgi:hypothetical protein